MKRIISLCCIALILVTSMAAPARASMVNDSIFINLLDYTYPNNGNSRFVSVTTADVVTFDLPEQSIVDYIEVLVVITDNIPYAFAAATQSNYYNLNVEQVDGSLYRLYGYLDGYSTDQIKLHFATDHSYLIFQSVKIATASLELHPVAFEGTGFYPGGTFNMSKNFGDNRPTQTLITNSDFDNRDFTLYLESQEWKKYDYIEYQLSLIVDDITSVSCVMGSDNIPIDVSYFDNSTSDSYTYITITIDCRYLDRTSEDFPMIIIMGSVIFDGVSAIQLMNSNGIVVLNDVNPLFYYFNNLFSKLYYFFNVLYGALDTHFANLSSWMSSYFNTLYAALDTHFGNLSSWLSGYFNTLYSALDTHFSNLNIWIDDQTATIENFFDWYFTNLNTNIYDRFSSLNTWIDTQTNRLESAIRGDTAPGDSFQDEVDQKDQELDDMAAVMDSVKKPDIESFDVSVDQYVSQSDLQVLASPMAVFFEADIFSSMIIMSILLATVSYVLYGKR